MFSTSLNTRIAAKVVFQPKKTM